MSVHKLAPRGLIRRFSDPLYDVPVKGRIIGYFAPDGHAELVDEHGRPLKRRRKKT